MSIIPATLLGSSPTSSDIFLAIGPTVTIAIVLLAVQISTRLAKVAIPNSAFLLFLNPLNPLFNIQSIPPLCFINDIVPDINSDIIIDKKYKEIIKIIKKTINNSKNKDIDFDSVTTCLSMVLYATKYNLKLGYTLDGVTERLDCTKAAAERGIKLYKNINRNMYEKNQIIFLVLYLLILNFHS